MNITDKRRTRLLASLLMLAIVSLACTLTSGTANTPPAPTQAATATATAAPATATPVPPTPRPTVDRTAEAQRLTAEAFSVQQESVRAELRELGLPADGGKLEWFSDAEILLRTVDYQGVEFHTLPVSDAANFVLKVDITWDTTSGLAGCALPFRAAGDIKNEPTYMLMMMRLSGAPAWDIEYWEYGLSQRMVRAAEFTDSIDDRAGRKNTLVLVAQDNEFSVFINGDKMSTARDARLTSGQIGFAAWQESGETTCGFSNAWLWTFDE